MKIRLFKLTYRCFSPHVLWSSSHFGWFTNAKNDQVSISLKQQGFQVSVVLIVDLPFEELIYAMVQNPGTLVNPKTLIVIDVHALKNDPELLFDGCPSPKKWAPNCCRSIPIWRPKWASRDARRGRLDDVEIQAIVGQR